MNSKLNSKKQHFETDNHFKNDTARNAYLKFFKYGGPFTDETSGFLLSSCNAVITAAVDSFAILLGVKLNYDEAFAKLLISNSAEDNLCKIQPGKGGPIPIESVKKMKFLLPVGQEKFLFLCYVMSRKVPRLCGFDISIEAIVYDNVSCLENFGSNLKEHIIFFQCHSTKSNIFPSLCTIFWSYLKWAWLQNLHFSYL